MRRTFALAFFLGARRRSVGSTQILLALGMVAMTVLALASVGVPRVIHAQHDRQQHISAVVDPSGSAKDPRRLRMVDPVAADGRRWDGFEIARSYYVRGRSSLVAPGLTRMPSAGDYYASPALADLIRENPTVAGLFAGRRQAGLIGSSGLVQPHELRAVEGIGPDVPLLLDVERFGTPSEAGGAQPENMTLDVVVAIFVVALVWLPALAFLVVILRLSSRQAAARARSLRLVGLSMRATTAVSSLELMRTCAPAVVLGCLLHDAISRHVTRVPFTALGFDSADAETGLVTCVEVGSSLLALVVAISTISLRGALTSGRLSTPVPLRIPRSRTGAGMLAGGAFLLAAMPVLIDVFGTSAALLLWLGCILVALGIALAGPAVISNVLRRIGTWSSSATALAGSRLASTESASLRLGSMFSLLIVLLLGSLSFMSILNGGNAQDWDARVRGMRTAPVVVNDLLGELRLATLDTISPGSGAVQLKTLKEGGRDVRTVFGDCSDLEELTGHRGSSCQLGPDGVVRGAGLPGELDGARMLPGRLAPTRSDGTGSYFYLVAPAQDLRVTLSRITSAAPSAQLDLGDLDRHNPDTQRFPFQLQWLQIGTLCGLVLGGLALTAVAVGETRERRDRMRGLRMLGARQGQMLATHLWATSAPIMGIGWLATIAGWLVSRAMSAVDDRAGLDGGAVWSAAATVMIAGLFIGLVTCPDARWSPRGRLGPGRRR